MAVRRAATAAPPLACSGRHQLAWRPAGPAAGEVRPLAAHSAGRIEQALRGSTAPWALLAPAGCAVSVLATWAGQPCRAEEEDGEGVPLPADLSKPTDEASAALSDASPSCRCFVAWILARGIDVVVFDMDLTMGSGHCGPGLPRAQLQEYLDGASPDFVEAVRVLGRLPCVRLAVATMSDPAEYDLPGQSRESHILGPDLARALIEHWCPEALPRFEIMVGFDPDLHKEIPKELGKSVHMRRIASHYDVAFDRMVLIDDSSKCLENTDGWQGVLVCDRIIGFRFEDCLADRGAPKHAGSFPRTS